MKKILILLILLAITLAVWFNRHVQAVQTELILHGNIDIRQVELAFNASGRIDKMLVTEGDQVKSGQVLASLDTVRQQLSLTQVKAQSQTAREVLARYLAGSRPEEIRAARAQKDAARATLADAEAFYQRQMDLVARHFVSVQQADSARFASVKARAQLNAAEEVLRLAEQGFRKEDIAAARATLAASEAAEAVIQRDIEEGELHAPSAGVIENRILEPGDMASPQKPVFTLALTKPVWVRSYLPETALGLVPLGARAELHTDSGQTVSGWVGYISPGAEFTPKTVETTEIRASLVYQTRIFVCRDSAVLRQGMPVTVTIPLHQKVAGAAPCRD